MKNLVSTLILMIIFVLPAKINASGSKKVDKEVQKAFELRMSGKVDQAKTLLEELLAKDSTNAMAHFEMARLKHYMLLGGGQNDFNEFIIEAGKAVTYAPENVTFAYYYALVTFFKAYMGMEMQQGGNVKADVADACKNFEKVFSLKPDYYEAMMYLVEFYGLLPADMGGDSLKAAGYASQLAGKDKYFGAKAKAALLPEGTDMVKFWEPFMAADPKNANYLTETGKAYIYADDIGNAEKYFDKALKSDPSRTTLILDLARYHIYKVMQNMEAAKTELPIAKTYLEKYLNGKPEPVVPLKAYAKGLESLTERFTGNQDAANKLADEATALDPYFSRAAGIPSLLLFDPPDQISHQYFSFFKPF